MTLLHKIFYPRISLYSFRVYYVFNLNDPIHFFVGKTEFRYCLFWTIRYAALAEEQIICKTYGTIIYMHQYVCTSLLKIVKLKPVERYVPSYLNEMDPVTQIGNILTNANRNYDIFFGFSAF